MNQTFEFNRFRQYMKLEFQENGRYYLLSFGMIVGLMLTLMIPVAFAGRSYVMLMLLHLLGFFVAVMLGGSLLMNSAFTAYHDPAKGISMLMLPVSTLEKFLAKFLLLSSIITINLLIFSFLHPFLLDIANQGLTNNAYQTIPAQEFRQLTYIYFIAMAVFMLGSIYFQKFSFLKTAGYGLLASLFIYLLDYGLAYELTNHPDGLFNMPFEYWDMNINSNHVLLEAASPFNALVAIILIALIPCIFIIAYLRLKEKEL